MAFEVCVGDGDFGGSLDVAETVGEAEAAFFLDVGLGGEVGDFGVYENFETFFGGVVVKVG